ncbi:hypothetical protein GALMADRAFT_241405 [Galerina marginata CBS 339.88]|uniref:F-box domain-containing protein n=1 Tax=Galerina marginata (strain CBS 339.88) TaxID=685588 RepID=A0A067TCM7_GALM3|nr:hypothetical protein GALMADRAFT_241405 [Galerina marginata CBS 339.88]
MTAIPHEIWMHIAQFLPASVLQDLLSVNSAFFEVAMDYRYRQMSFAYLDNRMLRSLARLKDPAVAKRVRILHVYPGFLKEALEREKIDSEPTILRRSLRAKLVDIGNLLLEQKLFPKHPRIRLMRSLKRTEDVVQIMLEVLSGLPNVNEYYVTWCGLPSISATAVPFLSTIFQANLRKLSLELSLENMQNLLTPSFKVENLQELHLTIHSENINSVSERNDILRTHLAPAISQLRSTLQTLTIQSWEPADLSPMLFAIKCLPVLKELSIAIPVESTHLGDPEGLAQFLNTHRASLRTLRLRATQFGGVGMTPDLVSFDTWIRNAMSGVSLPKLRVLDITSNLFPVYTSILCLRHFSSTITSLSLTGCYRTYEDVEEAINLVSDRDEALCRLRIGLVSLSPQLVDLISSQLPRLFKLELVVKFILPHAQDSPEFSAEFPGECQRSSQVDEFLSEMGNRCYSHWTLGHMSVLADFLPHRPHYEELLEHAFRRCIPSIKTFT